MGETELIPSFSDKDKEEQMKSIYTQIIKDTEDLLTEYNQFLHDVAHLLLEKETVDGVEIEELKNKKEKNTGLNE